MKKKIVTSALAGAALVLCLPSRPAMAQPAEQAAPDPCAAAKITATIDHQAFEQGIVKAGGTWEVSGGAAGALVEVRLHSEVLQQSESFRGAKGTWEFAQPFKKKKCGAVALRIHAYPSVDLAGHLYNCLQNESSPVWRFEVPCR